MSKIRTPAALLALLLLSSPATLQAAESCPLLVETVKELCTSTMDSEPVWLSCAFYYRTAFEVLRKGGDEKWTLDDHCRSLHGTMERATKNKQDRGGSAEPIPGSDDPRCPEQREEILERCLALFDGDELPAEIEVSKCAGRFGLAESGRLEHCG